MKNLIPALLLSALVVVACSKDDEGPETNSSSNQLSIDAGEILAADSAAMKLSIDNGNAKTWATSAFTLAGRTTFTSCRLDDTMEFNADGTYIYNGGSNLCGAEDDEQIKTGTWEIDFQNRRVIFDKDTNLEAIAKVIGQNDAELRLQGSYMAMEVRGIFTAEN